MGLRRRCTWMSRLRTPATRWPSTGTPRWSSCWRLRFSRLPESAPWLDGRLETTRKLVDLVVKSIGRKSLLELGGVETVFAHDPTVKFIIKNFPVDDGERRLDRPD